MATTHLFYDIETTGLSPCFDQAIQFAAIRSQNLQEVERYAFTIRLNCDVTPNPEAMKIHGISYKEIATGLPEITAMQKIHTLFNTPNTITLGYNTLGFDDEFLRFSFYRNLLPPYRHQFANGCHRMDIYPMTILYYLFRPDILQWPEAAGFVSLKLEDLNRVNHFTDGPAHQAIVDVEATLALAQRFYQEQSIWNYLSGYFVKSIDAKRIKKLPPAIHHLPRGILALGKFGSKKNFLMPALLLGQHNIYTNQLLWLKLDGALFAEQQQDLLDATYIVRKKLGEPPIVLPYEKRFLKHIHSDRLRLVEENCHWLQKNTQILAATVEHYKNKAYPEVSNIDADAALYQIPFPTPEENALFQKFHQANPQEKQQLISSFKNPVRKEQAIRLLGRHYPEVLTASYKEQFSRYLQQRQQGLVDYRGAVYKAQQQSIA